MKKILVLLTFLSGMAIANPNGGSGYSNRNIVKCSSRNGHRQTCYADTSGGVQLINQLSRSSCQGNWGYSNNQIWVNNGCRAKFQLYVGNGGNGAGHNGENNNYGNSNDHSNNSNAHAGNASGGSIVVCESHNSNRKTCHIPRGSRVSLYRQRSRSSCEHNWGFSGNEIWVSNGCRAEFSVSQGH